MKLAKNPNKILSVGIENAKSIESIAETENKPKYHIIIGKSTVHRNSTVTTERRLTPGLATYTFPPAVGRTRRLVTTTIGSAREHTIAKVIVNGKKTKEACGELLHRRINLQTPDYPVQN